MASTGGLAGPMAESHLSHSEAKDLRRKRSRSRVCDGGSARAAHKLYRARAHGPRWYAAQAATELRGGNCGGLLARNEGCDACTSLTRVTERMGGEFRRSQVQAGRKEQREQMRKDRREARAGNRGDKDTFP